jgi:cyclic-di-GMP-binding biofilm dispersal mediator protein
MTTLQGSLFLVVGATGGLGSAIARELEARGGYVLRTSRNSADLPADITDASQRAHVVELVAEHGGVDGLIVASGEVGFGMHGTLSGSDISRIVDVDLTAPLALVNDLLPHVKDGGNITLITGAVVDFPTLGMAVYTAAKAGLSASCAVLRRELRSRKINVLDARPPHTETGLATRAIYGEAPKMKEGLAPDVVAQRIVEAIAEGETELAPVVFGQ